MAVGCRTTQVSMVVGTVGRTFVKFSAFATVVVSRSRFVSHMGTVESTPRAIQIRPRPTSFFLAWRSKEKRTLRLTVGTTHPPTLVLPTYFEVSRQSHGIFPVSLPLTHPPTHPDLRTPFLPADCSPPAMNYLCFLPSRFW